MCKKISNDLPYRIGNHDISVFPLSFDFWKKVLNDLGPETITKVTLEKTIYDGEDEVTVLEPFLLNESELEQFYQVLSKTTLKDVHSNFFRYNTNIKYYMIFTDAEDVPWGHLKFFEDEFFTIDRAYADDTPSVHKLYRVHSSSLKTFFSSVCETRQQKFDTTNNKIEN